MWRLGVGVEHAVEIDFDRFGVEIGTVVEFDTLAERKDECGGIGELKFLREFRFERQIFLKPNEPLR